MMVCMSLKVIGFNAMLISTDVMLGFLSHSFAGGESAKINKLMCKFNVSCISYCLISLRTELNGLAMLYTLAHWFLYTTDGLGCEIWHHMKYIMDLVQMREGGEISCE